MLREKLALDGADFETVAASYFMYVFGAIKQPQFVRNVGVNPKIARAFLRGLKYDGTTLLNCKLYAWAWYRHKNAGDPRPRYDNYGLSFEDAKLLRRLNLSHLSLDYPAHSVTKMKYTLNSILASTPMRNHIGRLISAKLRFLIKSYGVTRGELESDLGGEGVRAVYFQYPRFKSDLHMTNVVKTTIHNFAMSTIKYHTCKKRQRLARDESGEHQALVEDLEAAAVHEIAAPEPYLEHVRDQLTTITELAPLMSGKVQNFLLSLAGHHNEGLSQFLKCDNSEAAARWDYDRYTGLCAQYFGLSNARVGRIFARLRDNLR